MRTIPLALTYDDVLIVPKRSTLISRNEAVTRTRLTKNYLNIPIVGSNMDTVSESEMAIAMARLGGISIIHRFMTIEENAEEIKRVKKSAEFYCGRSYTIDPKKTIGKQKGLLRRMG